MNIHAVTHLERTRPPFKACSTADSEHSGLSLKAILSDITKLHVLLYILSKVFKKQQAAFLFKVAFNREKSGTLFYRMTVDMRVYILC